MEHSEVLADQKESLRLYSNLATKHGDQYPILQGFVKYAQEHHDLIEKFSRFPHRNALLGRESTQAEMEHLESLADGKAFGVTVSKK